MKKVCVVTWYGRTNYGTNLQAFALLHKLQLLGYDAKMNGVITRTIDYKKHPVMLANKIARKVKRKFVIVSSDAFVQPSIETTSEFGLQKKAFDQFYHDNFPKLSSVGLSEWNNVCKEYAAFIVGSDQVWNPYFFNPTYMLDFVVDSAIRKVAYAPSVGVTEIPRRFKKIYRRLLKDFIAISVREYSAKELISELVKIPVQVVVDPTLLLDANEWSAIANEISGVDRRQYIICYFVGNRKTYWDYVRKVADATGYDVLLIPIEGNECPSDINVVYEAGPREFVWLIQNSAMVITDSFHASVFSIIFHKEFYLLKRFSDESKISQNDRLYNLLSEYNLSDRIIEDETFFNRSSNMDYEKVERVLEKRRKESTEFLVNSIES